MVVVLGCCMLWKCGSVFYSYYSWRLREVVGVMKLLFCVNE